MSTGAAGTQPPQEEVCGADERITVTVIVDTPVDRLFGLHTRLSYPIGLTIPGVLDDASVKERVTFLPVQTALAAGHPLASVILTYNDEDDRVQTLMTSLDSFADGPFVTITFDCVEGRTRPVADDFPCAVAGATDTQFNEIFGQSTCHAELASSS